MSRTMTRSRRAALGACFALAVLASCANYTPPATGPKAVIRFAGDQQYVVVDPTNSCDTERLVAKSSWPGTTVPAEQRIWISQGIDDRVPGMLGYRCALRMSFEPKQDATYVAEYSNGDNQCRMALYRLTDAGTKLLDLSARAEPAWRCR